VSSSLHLFPRPGCDDVKLGGEAVVDTSEKRPKLGESNERMFGNNLFNCNVASLAQDDFAKFREWL